MKKLLVGFLILIGGINFSIAQTKDFRGFNWGDTLKKVKSEEKVRFVSKIKDNVLECYDILGNAKYRVLFVFNDDNKLESGIYILTRRYSNAQLYFRDYNKLSKLLTEKYGNATKDKETWNINTPLDEKKDRGQGIADGILNLYSVWNTDRSIIKMTLISIENYPSLQIHYTTKSLDEFENEEDLKSILNKL